MISPDKLYPHESWCSHYNESFIWLFVFKRKAQKSKEKQQMSPLYVSVICQINLGSGYNFSASSHLLYVYFHSPHTVSVPALSQNSSLATKLKTVAFLLPWREPTLPCVMFFGLLVNQGGNYACAWLTRLEEQRRARGGDWVGKRGCRGL